MRETEITLKKLDQLYENKRQIEILEDYIVRNKLIECSVLSKENISEIGYNFNPNSMFFDFVARLLIKVKENDNI